MICYLYTTQNSNIDLNTVDLNIVEFRFFFYDTAEYVQRKVGAYIERHINKMATSKSDCTQPLSDEELATAMKEAFILLDHHILTKVKGTCELGLSRNAKV